MDQSPEEGDRKSSCAILCGARWSVSVLPISLVRINSLSDLPISMQSSYPFFCSSLGASHPAQFSTSLYLKMTRRDDDMQKETTDFYCNGRVITDALLLIVCLMRLYLYYFSGRSSLEIQWILSPMTIRRSVSWFAIDGWAQEGRYLEGNAELRKVCTHACDTRIQQKQYLCIISQGSAT